MTLALPLDDKQGRMQCMRPHQEGRARPSLFFDSLTLIVYVHQARFNARHRGEAGEGGRAPSRPRLETSSRRRLVGREYPMAISILTGASTFSYTVMDGTERGLLRGTCLERVTCLMLGARMFWAELSLRFPRDGPFQPERAISIGSLSKTESDTPHHLTR